MHTKDRLAQAIREAKSLPEELAVRAEAGAFDDFLSDSMVPQMDLVEELRLHPSPESHALIDRIYQGEFDATKEESDEWAASPAGQATFSSLYKGTP